MPVDTPVADRLLSYVMDEAALIVVRMDIDGTIHEANKYTETLVGVALSGKPFTDMILDFQKTFVLQTMLDRGNDPQLLNVVNQSGLPQTYYFHFYAYTDEVLAIGQQDVQELENLRYSLVQLNNELNNTTRQLQKKKVQLEKLDALKNQFFGMAAHDLRHPLGVIQMYSEFLDDEAADQLNDEHREFVAYIRQSSHLMAAILDDFLDISVFESGKLKLDCRTMDMVPWLVDIVGYTRALADRNQIEIVLDPLPERMRVHVDASKMEQVVNNLLSNAIKYSRPHSRVQVGLQVAAAEVVIHVQDNGPGIAQPDWARLFMPFERLTTGNKTKQKSSGLGLAIVKKIVDAHDGRVWVDSQVGQGTTFCVALPVRPDRQFSRSDHHP